MTLSKILAASVLALSFASPVLAQEQNTLAERNVYLFTGGKMAHIKATDAMHAMAMKEFTPIKDGTMIYVSGGKFYMSSDKKMANGQMLHTEFFGKDAGIGSQR